MPYLVLGFIETLRIGFSAIDLGEMWIQSAREGENVYVSNSRALPYVHSYIEADLNAALNHPLQSTGSWPLDKKKAKEGQRTHQEEEAGRVYFTFKFIQIGTTDKRCALQKHRVLIQRNFCTSIHHVSANVNISSKL